MSIIPNTTLKIGVVPFSRNSKHLIKFDTEEEQDEYMNENLPLVFENVNIIKRNTPFTIALDDEYAEFIEYTHLFNYLMYVNNDTSSTPYFAFIDKVEYNSNKTITIYHTIDVWQTYCFMLDFGKCKIERAHIKKEFDNVGAYTQKEPIGFNASIVKEIGVAYNVDWSPCWNLNTVSTFKYNETTGTYSFEYGGFGVGSTDATGGYTFPLSKLTNFNDFLNIYRDTSIFQKSHLDEVINLTCVPKWVENKAVTENAIYTDNMSGEKVYYKNELLNLDNVITGYRPKSLACGYVPKNNKMFTSLAKVLVVTNKNGLNVPLKPELFNENVINGNEQPNFTYKMRPINSNSILGECTNYQLQQCVFKIPYGATLNICYNANAGMGNMLNKLTSSAGLVGSLAGIATGIATGGVAPAVALGLISAGVVSAGGVASAFDAESQNAGSCSDVTSVSEEMVKPIYIEKSPTYEECRVIDDFLSQYGYALNIIDYPSNYFSNRSKWNYIKTVDCIIFSTMCNDDLTELQNIFNNGVTLWNSSNYMDYSGQNN